MAVDALKAGTDKKSVRSDAMILIIVDLLTGLRSFSYPARRRPIVGRLLENPLHLGREGVKRAQCELLSLPEV
jgi:hypothetical protein